MLPRDCRTESLFRWAMFLRFKALTLVWLSKGITHRPHGTYICDDYMLCTFYRRLQSEVHSLFV